MKLVKVDNNVTDDGHSVDLYVDPETGVQYFVMNHGNAGAICPRYNADGTLYVSAPEQR